MFLSWNGSSLYMHLSFIPSLKFKNWCYRVSAVCVCKRERLVRDSGPEFFPPPLGRQTDITVLYRIAVRPQLHLSFPPCWFLPCMWRFIFGSNFLPPPPPPPTPKKTTFSSYVPRFVLNNCSEGASPVSFTVVSCCSMSAVHFSRMTEEQCTAECNVSFGYNAAGGRRVVRCSD